MSENEFDVHRDNEKDARDNVVLTGEEIELPGDGSDAAAIIGEASEPINTGEIESVAIGGLTGRVPGAAPLKPTIEDKISTGELPVVSAPSVPSDEADFASASEVEPVDASIEAPQADAVSEHEADAEPVAEEPSEVEAPAVEESAVEESAVEAAAEESAVEEPSQVDVPTAKARIIEEPSQVDVPTAKAHVIAEPADEAPVAEEEFSSSEPVRSPIMTPAQAAAALGLNLDSAREDRVEPQAAAPVAAEEPAPIEDAPEHSAEASSHGDERASAVGGAAAEVTPSLPSRRSMIFGDDEPFSPSIPALSPAAQEARAAESAQEAVDEAQASSTVDVPTKKLPNYTDAEESAYTDVPTRKLSTRLAHRPSPAMALRPRSALPRQELPPQLARRRWPRRSVPSAALCWAPTRMIATPPPWPRSPARAATAATRHPLPGWTTSCLAPRPRSPRCPRAAAPTSCRSSCSSSSSRSAGTWPPTRARA